MNHQAGFDRDTSSVSSTADQARNPPGFTGQGAMTSSVFGALSALNIERFTDDQS